MVRRVVAQGVSLCGTTPVSRGRRERGSARGRPGDRAGSCRQASAGGGSGGEPGCHRKRSAVLKQPCYPLSMRKATFRRACMARAGLRSSPGSGLEVARACTRSRHSSTCTISPSAPVR